MKNKTVRKEKFVGLKKDFLTLENMSKVVGGKHEVKFCYTIKLKQCITEKAEYCGTGNRTEVTGPVNPWGE